MGNFAEMFAPRSVDPEEEWRRQMQEALAAALQPEPLAEVPVDQGPSKGNALAAALLGALGSGLTAYGGGGQNQAAIDLLNRRYEERRKGEQYNAQARTRNEAGARKARAMSQVEILRDQQEQERRAADREAAMAEKKVDLAARAQEKADALKASISEREDEQAFRLQMQKRAEAQDAQDRALRERLAQMDMESKGNKGAEAYLQNQNELLNGSRYKVATEIKAALRSNPNADVAQMREDYEDELDAFGLDPTHKEAALLYFDKVTGRFVKPKAEPSEGGGIGGSIKKVLEGIGKGASAIRG